MVLTKAKISENLFEKLQLTKKDSKKFVECFFEAVRNALENGEDVKLSGFGNFKLKHKKERPGRNPKTGESVLVTARRIVTFKAGQKLKNRIQNHLVKKNNNIVFS